MPFAGERGTNAEAPQFLWTGRQNCRGAPCARPRRTRAQVSPFDELRAPNLSRGRAPTFVHVHPHCGGAFMRDGSDTPKLASAWSSCSHERERVEALPLAHARGYSEDEEEGGNLSSKWFDRMPRGCLLPFPRWSAGVGEASPAGWRTIACGDTSALLGVSGRRGMKCIPR